MELAAPRHARGVVDAFEQGPAHETRTLRVRLVRVIREAGAKGKVAVDRWDAQDAVSSRYETEAYARWAATTLPRRFSDVAEMTLELRHVRVLEMG